MWKPVLRRRRQGLADLLQQDGHASSQSSEGTVDGLKLGLVVGRGVFFAPPVQSLICPDLRVPLVVRSYFKVATQEPQADERTISSFIYFC